MGRGHDEAIVRILGSREDPLLRLIQRERNLARRVDQTDRLPWVPLDVGSRHVVRRVLDVAAHVLSDHVNELADHPFIEAGQKARVVQNATVFIAHGLEGYTETDVRQILSDQRVGNPRFKRNESGTLYLACRNCSIG